MKNLKEILLTLLHNTEVIFDRAKFSVKKKLDLFDPIKIIAYNGFGNDKKFCLTGRILEDKGITNAAITDSKLRNIINMYKRLQTDEIPNAIVELEIEGQKYVEKSDQEGYFHFEIETQKPILPSIEDKWHEVNLTLKELPFELKQNVTGKGRIMIPSNETEFGIISDIDDTVLESNATSYFKAIRKTFVNNALTRMPFEGVAAFYRALQLGVTGKGRNPIFYVSSGLWNMYDLLVEFFMAQDIPSGPIFLQDYGIDELKLFAKGHKEHKYNSICKILEMYPEMKFILIGDSGQQDPLIYNDLVKNNPGRILTAYIRDVKIREKGAVVLKIHEDLREHKVDMLLVENTLTAAKDAAAKGYIAPESLSVIEQVKNKDQSSSATA